MRCKEAQIKVSMQIDGELSVKDGHALEQHLHICPRCNGFRAELLSLQRTLALWGDEQPSPNLADRFAFKLVGVCESPTAAPARRMGWLVGAAACAVVIAMLGVFLMRQQVTSPAPGRSAMAVLPQPVQPQVKPEIKPDVADGAIDSSVKTPQLVKPEITAQVVKPAGPTAKPQPEPAPRPRTAVADTPRFRSFRVAMNPFAQSRELSSRSGQGASKETMIRLKMARATEVEGETSLVVSDKLAANGLAMDQTIEKVRGALQKTVDHLPSQPVGQPDNTTSAGGGTQ